ncbi:unnamed protein product [Lampetra fluviatilis]
MSAGRRLLLLLLLLQEEEVVSSEEEQDLRLCTGERAGRGAIRCVRVSELPREVRVRGGVVAVTAAGGGSASAWASSASRDQAAARGGLGRGSANCTRGGAIALHALYAIAPRASARRASALQRDASPRRLSAPPRALVCAHCRVVGVRPETTTAGRARCTRAPRLMADVNPASQQFPGSLIGAS